MALASQPTLRGPNTCFCYGALWSMLALFDIGRDAAKCRKFDHERKWLAHARNDANDPKRSIWSLCQERRSNAFVRSIIAFLRPSSERPGRSKSHPSRAQGRAATEVYISPTAINSWTSSNAPAAKINRLDVPSRLHRTVVPHAGQNS